MVKVSCTFFSVLLLLSGCLFMRPQKIDEIMREYTGDQPGAAVMVIQDGKIIFQQGYGLAELRSGRKVTPRTNFRLASVTKQFTALSIMMLQEKGKISYDTSLRDIFPNFPDYGQKITVRHLLQHTSGLLDYESLIPDTVTIQVLDEDVLDMMMQVDSTYFVPGTKYRYSNSGYAVLAMIIEELSGNSFAGFLERNVFQPTGMQWSVAFEEGTSTIPHRAFGYTVKGDSIISSDQSITSAVLGDGGIYSSVHDLYYWDQILYTDKLVTRESLERAFTPLVLPDGTQEIYGFGWRIDTYRGHKRIHHNGSTRGFRSVIQRYPQDKLTVIVLANRSEPNLFPLATRIADLYL